MRTPRRTVVALAAAVALTAGAGAAAVATVTSSPAQAASSGGVNIAYFTQWGIYQNGFYPKNLDTGGYAGKLDYLNYAFENIDPVNHTCFEATKAADQNESNPNAGDGAGDAFADYQKSYGADISVNGQADTWNQPIAGNFNQLKELKAKYPNLKILVSLGGWTYSKYFSDAAATDASRQKLVSSCIDMFIKGNLPAQGGYGGAGTAAGIFDGFDIDWEYPGVLGHTGNHFSPNDKANFTALLAEFRSELDAYGSANNRKMYLTAALGSGQDKIAQIQTDKIGQYLDYADIMTYDMHGGWEPTGPTNNQAPLYDSPNDPSSPIPPGDGKYNIDAAITAWTTGDPDYGIPGGFPASKLTIGYPFYYRGWTGVSAGDSHGLYQPASGPATGHALSGNVPGVSFYKELTGFVDNPSDTYFDPATQSAYFYDGTTFWSGDDARSIQAKADYGHCHGLAGSMMYSLEALDPAGTLFNDVVNATNGSASSCTRPTSSPTASASASPTGSPTGSPTVSPSSPPSSSPSASPTGTSGTYPAWEPNHAYAVGDRVSYGGQNYECIQAHTSLVGWEPPNTPALWKPLG